MSEKYILCVFIKVIKALVQGRDKVAGSEEHGLLCCSLNVNCHGRISVRSGAEIIETSTFMDQCDLTKLVP